MSALHTPGPWRVERYLGREDSWFVRGPFDERVCGQGSGPVVEANARLIAAAPELLEALEAVVCINNLTSHEQRRTAYEKAATAIAKARARAASDTTDKGDGG